MSGRNESLLVTAFDQRWKDYRIQFKTCRREFSEEAVHDLRIAARRFLAVLDIIRALDPQPRVQKTRRFFKDDLDELDELRDVQVMLVELEETLARIPELILFQPYLQKREKRLLRAARQQAKDWPSSGLKKRVGKTRAALEKLTADEGFTSALLQAVDNAFARVKQDYDQMDAQKPASIHQMRIAFKKFRYMVEIVQPALPIPSKNYFKGMHDYQSRMGDIRDISILLIALEEFAEDGMPTLDSKPIRRYFEKHLATLVTTFLEDKGELHTFWRAAPDQPFPWEKRHDPVHHPSRHRNSSGPQRGRRRQSASTDRKRAPEDVQDRAGPEGTGNADRPDSDQPVPAS
jgi:CHAD domain-containing protein